MGILLQSSWILENLRWVVLGCNTKAWGWDVFGWFYIGGSSSVPYRSFGSTRINTFKGNQSLWSKDVNTTVNLFKQNLHIYFFISFHWCIMVVIELWGKMIITTLAGKCHEIDDFSVNHFISELWAPQNNYLEQSNIHTKISLQSLHPRFKPCQAFVHLKVSS